MDVLIGPAKKWKKDGEPRLINRPGTDDDYSVLDNTDERDQ